MIIDFVSSRESRRKIKSNIYTQVRESRLRVKKDREEKENSNEERTRELIIAVKENYNCDSRNDHFLCLVML